MLQNLLREKRAAISRGALLRRICLRLVTHLARSERSELDAQRQALASMRSAMEGFVSALGRASHELTDLRREIQSKQEAVRALRHVCRFRQDDLIVSAHFIYPLTRVSPACEWVLSH
jgi:septal ring factor EnvC (AmiA/AmiB activator)